MDYAALGQRVRVCRRAMHLTQEALAERVGISTSFLQSVADLLKNEQILE